jgi:hypothetical protein
MKNVYIGMIVDGREQSLIFKITPQISDHDEVGTFSAETV